MITDDTATTAFAIAKRIGLPTKKQDDNFASIIGAVEEGRRQYEDIQQFLRYLLSSNTGEVIAIFVNILLGGPLILVPVQILWMNLVTDDGMTAVAFGLEPIEKGVMNRLP